MLKTDRSYRFVPNDNLLDEIKTQDPVEKGWVSTAEWWHGASQVAVQLGCGCCLMQPLSLAPEDHCRGGVLAATCVSVFDACLPCSDQQCSSGSLPNLASPPGLKFCLPVDDIGPLLLVPQHPLGIVGLSCNLTQHATVAIASCSICCPLRSKWLPHRGCLKPHLWGPCIRTDWC